jgi:hypothetical protein
MRGIRLASLLALVLALSGGFAAPGRLPPGPRVTTAIAWYQPAPEEQLRARRHVPHAPRFDRHHATPAPVATRFVRPAFVTHSLFRRPPPARRFAA